MEWRLQLAAYSMTPGEKGSHQVQLSLRTSLSILLSSELCVHSVVDIVYVGRRCPGREQTCVSSELSAKVFLCILLTSLTMTA